MANRATAVVPARCTLADLARRDRVVQLRNEARTYVEIGDELGITAQRAGQLYRSAVATANAELTALASETVRTLRTIVANEATPPLVRVKAAAELGKWCDRYQHLMDKAGQPITMDEMLDVMP